MTELGRTLDRTFYRDLRREYPVVDRGEGIHLWDTAGRRYIDGAGGMYVVNVGHGVPEIVEAMAAQARKVCFAHVAQFTSEAQIELSNRLAALAPPGFGRVWLVSGGSEATESALKLARQYHVERGNTGKHKVVSRWHSYHGNTIGALSMSGTPSRRRLYSPYLLDFPHIAPCYCFRCPYNLTYPSCGVRCAEELEHVITREGPESIAAFIAEPIVAGPLGMATPPAEYFRMVRDICDRYDVLMIDDEVICGVGRTGRNFGIDHWDVVPDIIVTGKVVTGGYAPVGAVIAHERVHAALERGSGSFVHGYTYSGNPLSSAIGVAVLDYIQRNDLIARAAETGEYLFAQADAVLRKLPIVGDIRGKGLLMGIELVADPVTARPPDRRLRLSERVVELAFARGLILVSGAGGINGVAGDYVCLAPPYTITRPQVDEMLGIVRECLDEVSAAA
jgi:adenosylmethionine-8-amino-7-oxononanoate aminotransferase